VCEWSGNVKELRRDVRTKDDMLSPKNTNKKSVRPLAGNEETTRDV
jgi:hypothetical protein